MRSELEMMAYHEDDHKTTTAKVKRAVVEALREVHELVSKTSKNASLAAEEARKAFIMAQKIDASLDRQRDAQIKAKANELATLKSQSK